MLKKIEEASAGRFLFDVYHRDELMPTSELFEGVSRGVIEYATAWPAYYAGLEPSFNVFGGMPYSLPTWLETHHLIRTLGFEDLMREVTAPHNVYLVSLYPVSSWGALQSTVPIRTLDDFKGKKIRGYGIGLQTVELFGAKGVAMPGGDIYTAMATGVIDAAMWGTPKSHDDMKLYEMAKYWIEPAIVPWLCNMEFVNMDAWNALPDDLKVILDWAVVEAMTDYSSYMYYEDALTVADWKATKGVEFITLPVEDQNTMREAGLSLWDEAAAADARSAEAVAMILDFMKVQGYLK
jgi:TRAP-type C4-dicarboxylate transport system substrate-binding protein